MLKRLIFIFFTFNIISITWAQDVNFARQILSRLCSNDFHGRGYALGGDSLAANFLCNEFKLLGINPIMQPFALTANVFENNAYIVAGKDTLKAGRDFVVNPTSQSVNSTIKLSKDFRNNDSLQIADLLIFAVDKLPPQGISDQQTKKSTFYVDKNEII